MTSGNATTAAAAAADPHLWLEEVLGEKQLAWVEKCNKGCLVDVGDPKETDSYKRIKDILDSKVRQRCKRARSMMLAKNYDFFMTLNIA